MIHCTRIKQMGITERIKRSQSASEPMSDTSASPNDSKCKKGEILPM